MHYKITLLPGDGIGPETIASAMKILNFLAEKNNLTLDLESLPFGGISYEEHGTPVTDETIDTCKKSDVVFLGAVGGYKWDQLPRQHRPESALLKLRKELAVFNNIRPAKVYNSFLESSSLKKEVLRDTDFVVLRELTGGIYFGQPRGNDADKGWNTMVYHREEVERMAVQAFELARTRRNKVTSVDKANVLECSQLWRDTVLDVHKKYQDVQLEHMYVDNAAMQIVRAPRQFDVVVTGNMFGDILSDIAGMITGSLGMLPSASIGLKHALYEPVHGSAPDIAGKNVANPIAAIASVGMMFEHSFKIPQVAKVVEQSIEKALADGYRTQDINFDNQGKTVSTTEITEIILNNCKEIMQKVNAESGNFVTA
ncbi:MAG: 3-isopropylmalate dehydrogenase [Calditrichae bacterium]|nr:3-isopropylmalate dehydrogenase [Calditrichota bacterium]MCB9059126.1 3-isopropylmalate dehydrogenase [Calditrichia bacterium]